MVRMDANGATDEHGRARKGGELLQVWGIYGMVGVWAEYGQGCTPLAPRLVRTKPIL
jgi:hypothetical protein